jgi:hypothetical protein
MIAWPKIVDIPDCPGDFPGDSPIYRWKGVGTTPMMDKQEAQDECPAA